MSSVDIFIKYISKDYVIKILMNEESVRSMEPTKKIKRYALNIEKWNGTKHIFPGGKFD